MKTLLPYHESFQRSSQGTGKRRGGVEKGDEARVNARGLELSFACAREKEKKVNSSSNLLPLLPSTHYDTPIIHPYSYT